MSNHSVKPKDEKHEVLLGWDPMLNTFFLHVIDTTKDEDDEKRDVLWIGCTPDEIYSLDVIVEKAAPYAKIDEETKASLYAESNT